MSEYPPTPAAFVAHLAQVTSRIDGSPLDRDLEAMLDAEFPPDGDWYAETLELCQRGCSEGWLCAREAGGIKFGRAVAAGAGLGEMSVDVVEMTDVVGPHHCHPNGEIDLVMPLDATAQFDGTPAGWKVYGPGTAHHPTVTGGKALVLYLLPGGAIEFTRS